MNAEMTAPRDLLPGGPVGFLGRRWLIILVPLAKPEGDRIFSAKVQDLADFKGGDRFYINLSDTHIRVTLGDTKVTVAPKQAKIFKAPALAKPTNTPIMYTF